MSAETFVTWTHEFESDLEGTKPWNTRSTQLGISDDDDEVPLVKKQKFDDDTGGGKQEMLYDEPSTSESSGALNTVTAEACDIVEK